MAMSVGAKLISAFVLLIIGTVLISTLSTSVLTTTAKTKTTETISLVPARLQYGAINETYYFHLANGCPLSNWRADYSACEISNWGVHNSSGGVLVDPTDVVFMTNGGVCTGAGSGDLHFVNTPPVNNSLSNTTTVTYDYCPETYNTSSWGRTATRLTVGLMAIALFLGAVGFFYSVGKDTGIIS